MERFFVLAVLFSAHAVLSFPRAGGDVVLMDEGSQLLPNSDDEATINAEVNKDIQNDVDMDSMGESPQLTKGSSDWEKKTVAAINTMSNVQLPKGLAPQDQISKKFAEDVKQAQKIVHGPKVKKTKQLLIDQEADAALKNPNAAKQLKEQAEQAERDIAASFVPVSLIQEGPGNLGEDDLEANLKMVSGSNSNVMKAINAQIGEQVSAQLGRVPDTIQPQLLDRFEQDKEDASKFLMKTASTGKAAAAKEAARRKVEAELKSAQATLGEAKDGKDE